MLSSRIVRHGQAFLLEVDGQEMPMYGYMSYQPTRGDYEGFKKIGVHLFFTGVYAGDRGINQGSGIRPFRPGFWKGYGQYDFSPVDEDFRIILGDSKPGENYLIPRLMLEPPIWWDEANPDELCRDAQGTPLHHSFCSQKWLSDVREVMIAFRDWLEESGWAQYVPGWHIAAGNTEEFIRPSHHAMQFTDYSKPAHGAFVAWLRQKYSDVSALNAAWHTAYEGFAAAQMPTPAQRMFAAQGDLRDEALEQQTIDYYAFQNESHAQAAVSLCRMAKEVTAHQQVVGAFFGCVTVGTELGLHASSMVYESEFVDFLASPFQYTENRGQGVDWPFQGALESARLHGKPWFVEADVRTHLSEPISRAMPFADPVVGRAYDGPVWFGPKDIEGSIGQMTKALARILTHNTAVWWFDMWGHWYQHEMYMAFHQAAYDLYCRQIASGGTDSVAQIALFLEEEQFSRVRPGSACDSYFSEQLQKSLGYLGAPYELYLMDDLAAVDPAQYRLAIFPSVTRWTKARLEALQKWKGDGRVLAFTGPLSSQAASGVQARIDEQLETQSCGVTAPMIRFALQRGDVAMGETEGGHTTALLRRFADYSVYVTRELSLTAQRSRELACAAGAQVYTFAGDSAYASKDYVAVHAATAGMKRICLPEKADLIEWRSGKKLPGNESYIDVNMEFGETLLLTVQRRK